MATLSHLQRLQCRDFPSSKPPFQLLNRLQSLKVTFNGGLVSEPILPMKEFKEPSPGPSSHSQFVRRQGPEASRDANIESLYLDGEKGSPTNILSGVSTSIEVLQIKGMRCPLSLLRAVPELCRLILEHCYQECPQNGTVS